jgi:ribosome biogenesis GTPase
VGKKKRKKLRVAFQKNRQKRTRTKFLTREVLDQADSHDSKTGERLSGKGDLTRHRTIIGVESDDGHELLRDVDESQCLTGRVVSAVGLHSLVQAEDGLQYECTVRRVIRTMSREARNAVVTGDLVIMRPLDNRYGVIERVNPRRGTISRGTRGQEHIIVANVDRVLIVVSAYEPNLKPNLIDRFLISAEKGEVSAIICINKVDLVDLAMLQPIAGLYASLGYDVVLTSAIQSIGIARLRNLLTGRETVLAGQSGVGKSSLLNAVQPRLGLKITKVSNRSHKGRHTTRRAELIKLDVGGWVVDTPGIRQFGLWDVIPEEVEGFFIEFRPFVTLCKFPDCSHTHESGCGVKQAVEHDLITRPRYESYLKILSDDTG